MKKEHMLLAGAGVLGLIYLLSRGAGGGPMMLGGGGGLDPGLETITSETITIPAGGEEVGGSILLPPPTPGAFFDAPDWVRPAPGREAIPTTKKERFMIEQPTPYIGRADVEIEYTPYTGPVGDLMPREESEKIQAGWAAAIAARKEARLTKKESISSQLWSGAKMGAVGSIPGQLITKIGSWF